MEIAIAPIHSGASAARGSSVLNLTNQELTLTHIYNCNLDLDPGELNFGLGSQGNIIFLI